MELAKKEITVDELANMTENLKIQKKKQRVAGDVPMISVRSKI